MRQHLACGLLSLATLANAQNIFTVAGLPYTHRNSLDSQPALAAPLGSVYGLLIDRATGRLLFNESLVLRLEPGGTLLALAGGAPIQAQAPQSLASAVNFQIPRGMAQDAAGALYLSDAAAGRVYRLALDGTVTTFAGGGTQAPGPPSDGGLATSARLQSPRGLVFDSKGNLDIAEVFCNCIRQVTPAGIISTLYTLPPSPTPNRLPNVEGLAIDAKDNLYVAEWFDNLVWKIAAGGLAATAIAGTGTPGFRGDGGPATAAQLNAPSGVALDAAGKIYIADTQNHRIRTIASDGTIATIAGSGTCGFSGDAGPALAAQLCMPAQTVFDTAGNLIVADYANSRLRQISPDGAIATIAGSGQADPNLSPPGSSGNGGPEIHATFNLIGGAAFDPAGNLYVGESQGNVIRKIAPSGAVTTFAGTGQRGYTGDGGPATQAQLFNPGPLFFGPDGALYFITSDSRIRKITPDGNIALVAGTGTGTGLNRAQGDGGPAVNATLNEPGGIAFDRLGNIFIADTSNARVRKIDPNGIITTAAGPGQTGVDYYNAVAVDLQGNLYVAWTHAPPAAVEATVNRVNADGSLTPIAGAGQPCTGGPGLFTGDGLPARQVRLCAVTGLTVDPTGLLNLTEGDYSLVLRIAADGTIQRVAGTTASLSIGDGGPAAQASLVGGQGFSPSAVTFGPTGNLFLSEPGLNVIRQLTPSPYKLQVSPDRITAQSQVLTVSGNFAEPFAYQVRVSTTDGAHWLTGNRVTGLTGESIIVTSNPAGLPHGSYQGTVSVIVSVPAGAAPQEVDIPVSLTVP